MQIERAAKESSMLRSHPDGLAMLLVDDEREDILSELERYEVEPVQHPILPKPIITMMMNYQINRMSPQIRN